MRTIIVAISMLGIYMLSYGQNTWSKEYDLGDGRKNFIRNIIVDKPNDKIYLSSWQFCPTKEANTFLECSIISNYSKIGDLIMEVVYDSTAGVENGNSIMIEGELNHISILNTDSLGKYYQLIITDKELKERTIRIFNFGDYSYCIMSGIRKIKEEKYIYGTLINYSTNKSEAFFAKLDDSLNVEIIHRYPARQLNVEMNDLQATPDGNLAFILKQKGPAGSTSNPGFEIYKVNYEGSVLDSFVFNEGFGLDWPFNLTIDSDGNYYFYSDKHPIEGFPPSIGRMNKLNKDMKTLEWSVILPNSTYGRNYRIEESLLARNGDIIICGSMQDFLTFENSPDHVHTGFITRFDQDGNILWHHLFKMPNDEYLPQSEYGRYRFSRLTKIVELEDGSLLAGGNHAYHWTVYDHPDFDDTKETNLLWLLKVDVNGCLEGEECDEVIEIGRGIQSDPVFEIGTKWTFDFEWYDPFSHSGLLSGPYEIAVADTFRRNDSLVYVLKNNIYPNTEDWMYQENEQIYLWMGEQVGWQLTYDFDANVSYESTFYNPRSHGLDTAIVEVNTDPSINLLFGDRGIQPIQELTIENNGTYDDMPVTADILYHCGNLYGGISLGLGLGLADPPYIIGKLRCFEQSEFSFNFTSNLAPEDFIACDSVTYISGTEDKILSTFKIYPNPAGDFITIDNVSPQTHYTITDYLGRLMQQGTIGSGSIDIQTLTSNVYFIRLQDTAHKFWVAKFVKE